MLTRRRLLSLLPIVPATAAAQQPAASSDWTPVFDGKSLAPWWQDTPFPRQTSPVRVENGAIRLHPGQPLTGITWKSSATQPVPVSNYEIRFEATRLQGNDFFASLTFPASGTGTGTWVLGGWGGDIVGISSIDGWDASDNQTRTYFEFENGRWYAFRLRVTEDRIEAWIDGQRIIDVEIRGRSITLRPGDIKLSAPLGFASYNTGGAIRKIEYRRLATTGKPR